MRLCRPLRFEGAASASHILLLCGIQIRPTVLSFVVFTKEMKPADPGRKQFQGFQPYWHYHLSRVLDKTRWDVAVSVIDSNINHVVITIDARKHLSALQLSSRNHFDIRKNHIQISFIKKKTFLC